MDLTTKWNRRGLPRRISLLKIDCEGCEFNSLTGFLQRVCVLQVLIEVHGCMGDGHKLFPSFMASMNSTYGVFHSEPNIMFSDGTCLEYSLLRRASCSGEQQMLAAAFKQPQTAKTQTVRVASRRHALQ